MMGMMPDDSGDLPYNSIYGVKNCNVIRDSERRPITDSKSDAVPKGLNVRAETPRFGDEHPLTFYSILRTRNNVEGRLFFE